MSGPVFARATPKSIKLTEKYIYSTRIDFINDDIRQSEEMPEGRLDVTIPYDGVEFVNKQTFDDVKRQVPGSRIERQHEARVGYLGFANYERTDIQDNLSIKPLDVLPLELPLNHIDLEEKQQGGNHFACRFRHDYQPQWPDVVPVALRIELFDEDDLNDLNCEIKSALKKLDKPSNRLGEGWPIYSSDPESDEDQIAHEIEGVFRRYSHAAPQLRFYFYIDLFLPPHALTEEDKRALSQDEPKIEKQNRDGDEQDNSENQPDSKAVQDESDATDGPSLPKIARFSVQWPISLSTGNATLRVGGARQKGGHDPAKSALAWADIEFRKSKKSGADGAPPYHFTMRKISLSVQPPDDLYHEKSIDGEIEIKIPYMLSGLQVSYFDAMGQQKADAIERTTTLLTKFKIDLHYSFVQKRHFVTQQVEFAGVILDEFRLDDIQRMLRDFGFGSDPRKSEHEPPLYREVVKDEFYLVNAAKGEDAEEIKLWMIVKGQALKTTRERKIPGEHSYTTVLGAGRTTLNMYGTIQGDRDYLVELMNAIHLRLKEQFAHVSIVD